MHVAEILIARADARKALRGTFDAHWQEIHDIVYPGSRNFQTTGTPGEKAHQAVLDGTPEQAADMLAAALIGLLTNPSTKWFSLRARDAGLNENEEAALWFEDSTGILLDLFNSPVTGFWTGQHEKYMDLVSFGTGGQFIAEELGFGPRFQTRSLTELYLGENEAGALDEVDRRFTLTARQAVEKFGVTAVHANVAERAGDEKRRDDKIDFLHSVFPRREADPRRRDASNLPVASIYVDITNRHIVSDSGFHEHPYVTPRWQKRPGEVYGRGPGMRALPDSKMLQRVMKATIRGAEKVINPPLEIADDGVMSAPNLSSGALNIVRSELMQRGGAAIRAIQTNARPDLGDQFMDGIRERVGNAFFRHLLQMFRDPRMTATQVLEIAEETMRVLGPFLGRMQTEDLDPTIERTFAIALRAGALPELPEVLSGADWEVEYVSPLARAQRLAEARGIAQTFEFAQLIGGGDPAIFDNFDKDGAIRHVADLFGMPKNLKIANDRLVEIRTERAKVAALQTAKEDLKDLGVAAKQFAGAQAASGQAGQASEAIPAAA